MCEWVHISIVPCWMDLGIGIPTIHISMGLDPSYGPDQDKAAAEDYISLIFQLGSTVVHWFELTMSEMDMCRLSD